MPLLERNERGGARGRREPGPDEERLTTDAVREIADRQEAQHREEVADAEDHADVLRGRADVAQEERLDRREQAETDTPEDLRAREQPDVAGERGY